MDLSEKPPLKRKSRDLKKKIKTIYNVSQITQTVVVPFTSIGSNLKEILEKHISVMIEGKCINEGFVKRDSVRIITYSSGSIKASNVSFNVVFNCEICFPVAGMLVNCISKSITKVGICAESADETPSPFILFIARDHYYSNAIFNSIKEKQQFTARVIEQRFELNDKYVSIIGEIVPKRETHDINKKQILHIES
jgi:DNA-directed RNA polymerase subunit E'/Rpb7